MQRSYQIRRMALRNVCLVLVFMLPPCATYGQGTQGKSDEVAASIAKIKSGDFNGSHVEVIAKARAVNAIPALEEQFGRKTAVPEKEEIASALIRLGDKDNTYWNYLEGQAALAVDSDIPDAVFSESQGKWLEHAPSPELQAWADAHHVSADTAGIDSIYGFPGKLLLLGETGDPRGIPILRRALQARDYLIVAAAAKGLAQIQDKDSIPLIIAACRRAPEGYSSEIARSLIFFDDPEAQSTVDKYMRKLDAQGTREARAHGRKPID